MSGVPIAARARRDSLADDLAGIATIARLSLFEALRRRLLWALVGLTTLLAIVTAWAFQRLIQPAADILMQLVTQVFPTGARWHEKSIAIQRR